MNYDAITIFLFIFCQTTENLSKDWIPKVQLQQNTLYPVELQIPVRCKQNGVSLSDLCPFHNKTKAVRNAERVVCYM